jgi:hypothetical protein
MKVTDEMLAKFCKYAGMIGARNTWPNVRTGLEAVFAGMPEPVPGPFCTTQAELNALATCPKQAQAILTSALNRALRTTSPEQPSAEFPFRLTTDELGALSKARRFIGYAGDFMRTDTMELVAALDRAVSTLAAPTVEALSAEEEEIVRDAERCWPAATQTPGGLLIAIIRKRFPKPAPAEKTADDLERIIRNDSRMSDSPAWNEALAELVRRAEGK